MSSYGHLYITAKTGSFPSSSSSLSFDYINVGNTTTSTINDAAKIKRVYKVTTNTHENTPADNEYEKVLAYESMIALKKVNPSANMRLGIRRVNWESGVQYYPWSNIAGTKYIKRNPEGLDEEVEIKVPLHDTESNLEKVNYYVLTSRNEVFMCVKASSAGSTSQPISSGTNYNSTERIYTGTDGYIWRLMYVLSDEDQSFSTNEFIAIPSNLSTHEINTSSRPYCVSIESSFSDMTGTSNGMYRFTTHNVINEYNNTNLNGSVDVTLSTNTNGVFEKDSGAIASIAGAGSYIHMPTTDLYDSQSNEIELSNNVPPIDVISSPSGGYGSDIISQLRASTVLIKFSVTNEEADIPLINYTQIGLIENPYNRDGSLATASTLQTSRAIYVNTEVDETDNYNIGTKITQSNTNSFGITVTSTIDKVLKYIQPYRHVMRYANNVINSVFAGASTITAFYYDTISFNNPVTHNSIEEGIEFNNSAYASPEMQFGSGKIVYLENRPVVTKEVGRFETIVLAITF